MDNVALMKEGYANSAAGNIEVQVVNTAEILNPKG
jgi:hypothetical protein